MHKTLHAVRFLFVGPPLLVFLILINWMTFSGHWWVKWPAVAIGFVWVISLIRVVFALALLDGLAALVAHLRKK